MQTQENKLRDRGLQPGKKVTKKPYQKPEIIHHEPLEAMAAVCSPSPGKASSVGGCTVISS